jgi:tetratricopeptide (TPR) repeat protein
MSICQEAHLRFYFPWMAAILGPAYTLGGRVVDAVPLLTQATAQATAMEVAYYETLCHLCLGEAQMRAGRLEEAHALAARTLALARRYQERGHEASTLRLLGAIAARREPLEAEQAEPHYRQALALADELGMRPLQAHCHRGLGRLYAATGEREQARSELSTAIEMYQSMDMTFWLPQAQAALAQVEGR